MINGSLKTTHERMKGVGGWVSLAVTIYALAALLGAPLPKPAWSTDIQRVESKVDKVDRDLNEIKIGQVESDLRRIDGEIAQAEFEIANNPENEALITFLRARIIDLRADKAELERDLDRLSAKGARP